MGPAVHLVTGDLLDQENVEGLVLVEGANHIVSVSPRVGTMHVVLEAGRVGVARDVEPVAAVAFAVVRRREQPVDQPLPRVRRLVGDEARDFLWGGRQAEEIEMRAADERRFVGPRCGAETSRRPFAFEEPVDRVGEARVRHRGQWCLCWRLECPVAALLVGERAFRDLRGGRTG